MKATAADLPLHWRTPDSWAESAMEDVCALLDDHAHLERKAATNAMDLLNRWPEPAPPLGWVTTLSAIARDETDHLFKVSRLLAQRGRQLTRIHKSGYASALRELIRMGSGPDELIDRLLVSALIELRSCERFEILGRLCPEPQLTRLYRALWGSEHNHYRVFLKLARSLAPKRGPVDKRWLELLDREAEIIQAQPKGPRLHSSG
jgi:tRNA 2-(methylsulfanyl)-N6-isopentenyladenosine37 hydroxylase